MTKLRNSEQRFAEIIGELFLYQYSEYRLTALYSFSDYQHSELATLSNSFPLCVEYHPEGGSGGKFSYSIEKQKS